MNNILKDFQCLEVQQDKYTFNIFYKIRANPKNLPDNQPQGPDIFVRNIPFHFNDETLLNIFQQFGEVKFCKLQEFNGKPQDFNVGYLRPTRFATIVLDPNGVFNLKSKPFVKLSKINIKSFVESFIQQDQELQIDDELIGFAKDFLKRYEKSGTLDLSEMPNFDEDEVFRKRTIQEQKLYSKGFYTQQRDSDLLQLIAKESNEQSITDQEKIILNSWVSNGGDQW